AAVACGVVRGNQVHKVTERDPVGLRADNPALDDLGDTPLEKCDRDLPVGRARRLAVLATAMGETEIPDLPAFVETTDCVHLVLRVGERSRATRQKQKAHLRASRK